MDAATRRCISHTLPGEHSTLIRIAQAKKLAAPVSLLILVIVIVAAFYQYYGEVYYPPPILNTKFKYWSTDPVTNATKPYGWSVDYIKGPGDSISTFPTILEGRNALGVRVFKERANDTSDWANVHIRQGLRGQALSLVFNSKIRIWVYPTFSYIYDDKTGDPRNVFGVEVNDGTHLLWFVFTNEKSRTYELPLRKHRIVVTETPLKSWSLREVNISGEYAKAGWRQPDSLSFILIVGSTKIIPGTFFGYFGELEVLLASSGLSHDSLSSDIVKKAFAPGSRFPLERNSTSPPNT